MIKYVTLFMLAVVLSVSSAFANTPLKDELVEQTLAGKELTKPEPNLKYDYQDTDKVMIPIQITKKISSAGKYGAYEGMPLEFIVKENVIYNKQIIVPAGTKVKARVDIITGKGISGIPGELFITDFEIPNVPGYQIMEPISKRGQNRTLWILPLKWALTPLPPLGSFTNIIFGGDAVIKPKHTLKLYFYPNWI